MLIVAAKCIVGYNKRALARLQRNVQSIVLNEAGTFGNLKVDTLAAAVFVKVLHPVKHAIFLVKESLRDLISSSMLLFH